MNRESTSPERRSAWPNVLRIVLSGGLLVWVLSRVGLDKLTDVVRGANPLLVAFACLLSFAGIFIRAWRWQVLLRAIGARPPFRRLVYLYFVGQFFSTFLPTGFAGDVVRVLEAGEGVSSTQAAGTVLVDRLTGFIGLFLLALIALPFSRSLLSGEWAWGIAALSLAVVAGSILLFEGRLLRMMTRWLPGGLSLASGSWLSRAYDVIVACGARAILGALGVSTVFNVVQIAANVLLARALGVNVSALYFAMFVPLATVALLVPISIAGLGVREQIYLTLFASPAVGLSGPQAIALSLGAYGLDFVNGMVGGALYLTAGALRLRRKP
ncbi:MAG: flippase-like domain-containing protein [Chloroflexi bacterium]|nr:flippase-like domain-containing protein [Chloroflexota bacterium]